MAIVYLFASPSQHSFAQGKNHWQERSFEEIGDLKIKVYAILDSVIASPLL